jgi:hypothetical protein
VVDREEPEASRSEWHADGTAGENGRGSGLSASVPARAMGEARPRRPEPRWQGGSRPAAALEVLTSKGQREISASRKRANAAQVVASWSQLIVK